MFEAKRNYVIVNVKTKNFYEVKFGGEGSGELSPWDNQDKPLGDVRFNPIKDINRATRFDFSQGVSLMNDTLRAKSMSNIEYNTASLSDFNGDIRLKSNDYKLKYLMLVELEEKDSVWKIRPFYESYFL